MTKPDLLENLSQYSLSLPEVSTPGGNYHSVNIRGKIAYVAIQFPILNEEFLFQGRLGDKLNTADGYKAAELCALNTVAQISAKVGIEHVLGLNHFDLYFQAANNWDESPKVANGASDLFTNLLGELGQHSRAIIGVESLPRNFSVGLVSSFTLL